MLDNLTKFIRIKELKWFITWAKSCAILIGVDFVRKYTCTYFRKWVLYINY
jgi:hypothetical protein